MENSCVICGIGPSIQGFTRPVGWKVFGVNDCDRWISPDYLLVVNPEGSFRGDRWNYIHTTKADVVYSHLNLPIQASEHLVRIKLGKENGVNLDGDTCDYTNNSPYMACILAYRLGFRRIGLIGVDLVDHPHLKNRDEITSSYRRLGDELIKHGCEIWNFSNNSIVDWPYFDPSLLEKHRN
jgi:hypothetical protein